MLRQGVWGFSLQFWQAVVFWATVGTAAFGGLSVCAALVAGLVGYNVARVVQTDADRRIAEANAAGDEAKRDAAVATEQAEEAKLETERLKAKFAWRTVSQESRAALVAALSTAPAAVNLRHAANDPEAQYYAFQIERAFGEAGWQVASSSWGSPGLLIFGLNLTGTGVQIDTIRAAFRRAGVAFTEGDLPRPPVQTSSGARIDGAPIVFVGSKNPE